MPIEEDIQETRFARLDQAIARDIERRRRSHKLYWALLVSAALLAVLGLMYGRSTRDVATDVATDATVAFTRSDEFTRELGGNPSFEALVGKSASNWTATYASGPEFRALVQDAAGEGVRERFADVDAELDTLRGVLTQTEKTQTGLARRLESQLAVTEELSARLGAVSSQLENLGAGLKELQDDLQQLDARCQKSELTPMSFLLKENRSNPLPGLGISIQLGPRDGDEVEAVTISEGSVQLYPTGDDSASGAALRFGVPFEFADGKGNEYKATLMNAQDRFLARDFVGLDILVIAPGTAP